MSCVLGGSRLNNCGAYGETDYLSKSMVRDPVSVPDFFATVCVAIQIEPSKYPNVGDRPVPVPDNGETIKKLFS